MDLCLQVDVLSKRVKGSCRRGASFDLGLYKLYFDKMAARYRKIQNIQKKYKLYTDNKKSNASHTVLQVYSGKPIHKKEEYTSVWNFVPNSGLKKISPLHFSRRKVLWAELDEEVHAQSVINWTVFGQLSLQYLWRSTVSLSHWSSISFARAGPSATTDTCYLAVGNALLLFNYKRQNPEGPFTIRTDARIRAYSVNNPERI